SVNFPIVCVWEFCNSYKGFGYFMFCQMFLAMCFYEICTILMIRPPLNEGNDFLSPIHIITTDNYNFFDSIYGFDGLFNFFWINIQASTNDQVDRKSVV